MAAGGERQEARRAGDAGPGGDRPQRVWVVGFQHDRGGQAERGQDRLGQRGCAIQHSDVVARLGASQRHHPGGAIGEGGGEQFQPGLGYLVQVQRQHIGRQAAAEAGGGFDQGLAMVFVMQQHHRIAAAGGGVGGDHHAHPRDHRFRRRHGVGGSPCGADRGAGAAAGADRGVDRHVVAVRRDGAGGAEIEAAGAADLLAAAVRAQVFGEADIGRLVEGADQAGGVEDQLFHQFRVRRVAAQVAWA